MRWRWEYNTGTVVHRSRGLYEGRGSQVSHRITWEFRRPVANSVVCHIQQIFWIFYQFYLQTFYFYFGPHMSTSLTESAIVVFVCWRLPWGRPCWGRNLAGAHCKVTNDCCWYAAAGFQQRTELLAGAIKKWTRTVIKSGMAYKQSYCASTIQSEVR